MDSYTYCYSNTYPVTDTKSYAFADTLAERYAYSNNYTKLNSYANSDAGRNHNPDANSA
jgi:hypothetical protein